MYENRILEFKKCLEVCYCFYLRIHCFDVLGKSFEDLFILCTSVIYTNSFSISVLLFETKTPTFASLPFLLSVIGGLVLVIMSTITYCMRYYPKDGDGCGLEGCKRGSPCPSTLLFIVLIFYFAMLCWLFIEDLSSYRFGCGYWDCQPKKPSVNPSVVISLLLSVILWVSICKAVTFDVLRFGDQGKAAYINRMNQRGDGYGGRNMQMGSVQKPGIGIMVPEPIA